MTVEDAARAVQQRGTLNSAGRIKSPGDVGAAGEGERLPQRRIVTPAKAGMVSVAE